MNPLDTVPLAAVIGLSVILQILMIEAGFQLGRRWRKGGVKAQLAQVRAIMGASLGLSAFMLAFSFSMAQQHFEERARAYMLEVSAIYSAFRGADMLEGEARETAKELLARFANLRLRTSEVADANNVEATVELIRESERIHDVLWGIAEASMEGAGEGADTGLFAQSVLAMIRAHDERLQATVFNRISPIIWLALSTLVLLAMLVVGYQAGLTGTRSSLATVTLALAFSAVMMLIVDLDRPNTTLFRLNQQLMVELEGRMESQVTDGQKSPGL
jgi:hypothetical protein